MKENRAFCTIVTADYLPLAATLHSSLSRFSDTPFFTLTTTEGEATPEVDDWGTRRISHRQLLEYGKAPDLYRKYHAESMDAYRWSMKPVFLNYLMTELGYQKVIYLDSDLFFYNDPSFLFDALEHDRVILTPHWRSSDPHTDAYNFLLNYTEGLYNGGFVGVNPDAVEVMDWWADACLYICEKDPARGQFVDQTHLNLLPVFFEGVKPLRHRGCNVAAWNRVECPRRRGADGAVYAGDGFPVVFIHFTRSMIEGILSGEDALLSDHLGEYEEALLRSGVKHNPVEQERRELAAAAPPPARRPGFRQSVRRMLAKGLASFR